MNSTLERTLADALRRQHDPHGALVRAWTLTVAGLTGEAPATDLTTERVAGNDGVWCFDGAIAPDALLTWRATLNPEGPLALRVESTRLDDRHAHRAGRTAGARAQSTHRRCRHAAGRGAAHGRRCAGGRAARSPRAAASDRLRRYRARTVFRAGAPHAERPGHRSGQCHAQLRRARPSLRRLGRVLARTRRCGGRHCRRAHAALRRCHRRAARDPQGRRHLSTAGPCLSARAPAFHARRQRRNPAAERRRRAGRTSCRPACACSRWASLPTPTAALPARATSATSPTSCTPRARPARRKAPRSRTPPSFAWCAIPATSRWMRPPPSCTPHRWASTHRLSRSGVRCSTAAAAWCTTRSCPRVQGSPPRSPGTA